MQHLFIIGNYQPHSRSSKPDHFTYKSLCVLCPFATLRETKTIKINKLPHLVHPHSQLYYLIKMFFTVCLPSGAMIVNW